MKGPACPRAQPAYDAVPGHHRVPAAAALLAGFLKSLISRTSLILVQYSTHHEADCSVDEHVDILNALRSRNPEAAADAIVAHLRHVFERTNIGKPKRAQRDLGEILARYA